MGIFARVLMYFGTCEEFILVFVCFILFRRFEVREKQDIVRIGNWRF